MILFFFQLKQLEWSHSTDLVDNYTTAKDFYYAHLICVLLQGTMYQALYIGYACYFKYTCSKFNTYHWMEIVCGALLVFKLFFNAIAYKKYQVAFKKILNPPPEVAFSVNSREDSSYKRITTLTGSKETPRSIKTETEQNQMKMTESYTDLYESKHAEKENASHGDKEDKGLLSKSQRRTKTEFDAEKNPPIV